MSGRIVFTTASEAYDYAFAQTVDTFECDPYGGGPKAWRQVRLTGEDWQNEVQCERYASGLHGVWEKDPREEECETKARHEQRRLEREEQARQKVEGEKWLAETPVEAIEKAIEDDALPVGASREDARRRVHEARDAEARAADAAWLAVAKAKLPSTIRSVDDRGYEVAIYYGVHVDDHDSDPTKLCVFADGGTCLGPLGEVVWRLDRRLYQVVDPATVPPKAVLDRLSPKSANVIILTTEHDPIFNPPVYVGWQQRGLGALVLDGAGHLVRRKAVVEKALDHFRRRST